MEQDSYSLFISGAIVPKARPRFNGRHAYLPQIYDNWKTIAAAEMQVMARSWQIELPIKRAKIHVILHAQHQGKDADNLLGAILDAAIDAELFTSDSLACIPEKKVENRLLGDPGAKLIIQALPNYSRRTQELLEAICYCRQGLTMEEYATMLGWRLSTVKTNLDVLICNSPAEIIKRQDEVGNSRFFPFH